MRRFWRVGFTRFVNRMTNRSREGSTQIDVPVNPVCPNAGRVSRCPAEFVPLGVSHPSARFESMESCTVVNRRIVAADTMRAPSSVPPLRYIRAEARHIVAGAEQARVPGHAT